MHFYPHLLCVVSTAQHSDFLSFRILVLSSQGLASVSKISSAVWSDLNDQLGATVRPQQNSHNCQAGRANTSQQAFQQAGRLSLNASTVSMPSIHTPCTCAGGRGQV
jgi:hypothetical protein